MRNRKWYASRRDNHNSGGHIILHEGQTGWPGGRCAAGGGAPASKADHFRKGLPSLSGLVKETKPSVVNISTTTVVKGMAGPNPFGNAFRDFFGNDDVFEKFFGGNNGPRREFKQKSLGSGVIIDQKAISLPITM